jgi:hypothetical protein
VALSEQLSDLVAKTKQVEDRVAAARQKTKAELEADVDDAFYAIDYAYAAIEEAQYAVLDALLAHQRADELAQA